MVTNQCRLSWLPRTHTWLPAVLVISGAGCESPQNRPAVAVVLKTIPVQNAAVEVRVIGNGKPIILLSGTGADASSLDPFARALAESGFQAVAVNPRGVGRSNGPLDGLTLHDYAKDVAAVIDTLRLAPVPVLGWAGGNQIARCLPTDRPELVKAVILVPAEVWCPAIPPP